MSLSFFQSLSILREIVLNDLMAPGGNPVEGLY